MFDLYYNLHKVARTMSASRSNKIMQINNDNKSTKTHSNHCAWVQSRKSITRNILILRLSSGVIYYLHMSLDVTLLSTVIVKAVTDIWRTTPLVCPHKHKCQSSSLLHASWKAGFTEDWPAALCWETRRSAQQQIWNEYIRLLKHP